MKAALLLLSGVLAGYLLRVESVRWGWPPIVLLALVASVAWLAGLSAADLRHELRIARALRRKAARSGEHPAGSGLPVQGPNFRLVRTNAGRWN